MKAVAVVAGLGCLLAGCASYTERPLPPRGALASDIAALRHDHPLPPRFGVEDVARLALLNDPDLVASRTQHAVAGAQLLQAGLLVNPQASLSGTPTLSGPGTTTAWNAGATQDLRALILRPSNLRGAKAAMRQADAQVLWQEWQVVGRARLLAVQLIEGRQTLDRLGEARDLLQARVNERRTALLAGNATYLTLAPDLAALSGVQTQIRDAQRLLLSERHGLAALLGLEPDSPIPLADRASPAPLDMVAIRAGLPTLPQRRPDLVALRWGYENANQKLRSAILTQFPQLSFGLQGGSDNSNVRGIGPQITLELPVFDHGQGNIAIARANREQLRAEYAARLDATVGEVNARLAELDQITAQIAAARAALPAVRDAAAAAAAPGVAGLVDPQARVDLVDALLTRQVELVGLEQERLSQIVALQTLAGMGMPDPPPANDDNRKDAAI